MVCDRLQKIQLAQAAGTQVMPADAKEVMQTLYEMLTILDDKGLVLVSSTASSSPLPPSPPREVASSTSAVWRAGSRS